MPPTNGDPILRVEHLCTWLAQRGRPSDGDDVLKAVDGVSFVLPRGGTLGVVGESGSGKTTLARTILRLIPATSGRVLFDGRDVFALPRAELRRLRREMQVVFQDPTGSLNPYLRVEAILTEGLAVHGIGRSRAERRQRAAELLRQVGLSAEDLGRYPHEFSGGQRQRIAIARALAVGPKLVVCDEPVSALDVSIRSQILNLLLDLREQYGLSYLFIAHDLAVVRHFCDEVAVMHGGRFVEHAPAEALFAAPQHPYTRTLLSAAPQHRNVQPKPASPAESHGPRSEPGESSRGPTAA